MGGGETHSDASPLHPLPPRVHRAGASKPSLPASLSRKPAHKRTPHTTKLAHAHDAAPDLYALLALPPSASPAEIKHAYHHALLRSHPDKQRTSSPSASSSSSPGAPVDIGLLKYAYETLSSPSARAAYDAARARASQPGGPRPAQVVSLEDFVEEPEEAGGDARWTYGCRCGGKYVITERDMERGQHLVACASCSEVVWVGYELAEDGDGDEAA
ncbi:hypothetical protein WOLCODRAFT_166777 [Wolfiporia cocos MD-104 SS10]|uniref:Diphthamide biosynthesis protein 4 n=1 Tax=Wolfiporia cocos (strain MD-104) TaxID=742152 RepID=A0A2H3J2N4_WOLCO|nr:hypothetical protein WOLCODRAFT_166777 [Wolfiporia cocos MD-104 SS10]